MKSSLRALASPVRSDQWPRLPCPDCGGPLTVTDVLEIEDGRSRGAREHEFWEPEWVYGRFVTSPECACGAVVVVTGGYSVGEAHTPLGWQGQYAAFYRVEATSPGLRVVDVPDRAPHAVRGLAHEAAAVLWTSPPAAAGALRRAVEAMLDDLRVKKVIITSARKRVRLNTHERLQLLRTSRPEVADGLMAVKWVGNNGSHEAGTLNVNHVLDIADVFSYALRLAYDDEDKRMRQHIARINRRKGIATK